ncbi:hypothetical protein EC973_006738 [Apophysomyces ossiformis]|uniref:HCP-like protein n=1 Tax=Apophysomyces ossiformis TaxID=679940 RepID=A0A8H7BGK8_9FUNG|nr:hypothetical protein EC973_006738 [Apophysomyces ossiformis]
MEQHPADDSDEDLDDSKPRVQLRITNPDNDQGSEEEREEHSKENNMKQENALRPPPSLGSITTTGTTSSSLASVPSTTTAGPVTDAKVQPIGQNPPLPPPSSSSSPSSKRRESKILLMDENVAVGSPTPSIPSLCLDPPVLPPPHKKNNNNNYRPTVLDRRTEPFLAQSFLSSGSSSSTPSMRPTNVDAAKPAFRAPRLHDSPASTVTSMMVRSAPLSPALTNTSSLQTSSHLAAAMSPNQLSKYAKASYSLTNNPENIKLYRSMAQKTNDTSVQLMYAKYLLDVAELYEQPGHKKDKQQSTTSSLGAGLGQALPPATEASSSSSSASLPRALAHETLQKKKQLQEEGVWWIKRLARNNVGEAAYLQAKWMEEGSYGLRKNPAKSIRLYHVAAEANIPEAIYAVALHYEKEGQDELAVRNYKKAADLGLVEAVYRMANIHLFGECRQQQNMMLALPLLAKAAAEATITCPEPAFIFGLLLTNTYTKVNLPPQLIQSYGSPGDAPFYFETAAQLGHVAAQTRTAYISEVGLYGMPIDFAKSLAYYELAAAKGDGQAMLGLSRIYNRGNKGPGDNRNEEQLMAADVSGWLASTVRNEDEAFQWCKRAAAKDLPEALFLLGWYYEAGIGVLRDENQAMMYYEAAASKGHRRAVERLQRLKSSLPPKREDMPRPGLFSRKRNKKRFKWICSIM